MFTAKELVAFVHADLQSRREVYPRWVVAKKIKQREADERISKMEAIYRVLINLPDECLKKQG